MSLVVDASVALKWFLPVEQEANAPAARELIGMTQLIAPTLTPYEVGNVLTVRTNWPAARISEALAALRRICGAPEPFTTSDEQLATDLARRHALTYYDAAYAAVASRLACPLVSADDDLLAPGLAISIAAAAQLGS